MTAVVIKLLSLLTVLSLADVQAQTADCSTYQWSFKEISEKLKIPGDCLKSLIDEWTDSQTAEIFINLNRLVDIIKKSEKSACKDASPKQCPVPEAPSNGGVVCVSVGEKRYCKPMCNKGYDFAFLRRSRLYEECSNDTVYHWTTQYVGGNRLAICDESNTPIAGAPSAYFPENQDCFTTQSNSTLELKVINIFQEELGAKNIAGPYKDKCLMCGK
ncbi:uncharacterized protein DAT39_019712 [Clarias magur]|uniref:Uncharacterized protein n=1 Tax=Clarias magur TaxID=1594786 RepID=A0A8J4THG0_CLAMG|nr:uncharacterized protein DAT39_019712 [Clarias magur]